MEMSNSLNQTLTKNLKMREFIDAVEEYMKMKTESSAFIMKKFLQAYSVTIDMSVFDPDSSLGAQFYVSLYELFSKLEAQSQIIWDCVDVLINACRNCSARQTLINTYQFVPLLSRLLADHISDIKKKKLLRLMQDLTCGIKLTWQVPHLPHMLKMLTKWVEDKDQEIVCLSLGVLVNVCYKNLPALYTLSRIVDLKKFLRYCLPLQGPMIEIHVCKLMIIIDHSHNDIPKKTLLSLIEPTFLSILDSLTKNDPVMLRLVVDFFADMVTQENSDILTEYQHYNEQLSRLMQLMNARNTTSMQDTTSLPEHDPECVLLVLKFIYTLEIHNLGNLSSLYSNIIKLALDWVHSEVVSYQSLALLTVVAHNIIRMNDEGNKKLLHTTITTLATVLKTYTVETAPTTMDVCKRLGSLLQLLSTMVKCNSLRTELLKVIDENLIRKIFLPILSEFSLNDLPKLRVNENTTTSTDVTDAYVYALGLINELSQHDANWLEFLSMLMENSTIHGIIAHALYGSESKIKQIVLQISKHPRFPTEKIAIAMQNLQNMFPSDTKSEMRRANGFSTEMDYPIMSVSQMEVMDETLKKFKRLVEDHDPSEIPAKQVMELYEYKIASLAHSERSALNSIEAASDRCVHLQHRLSQMTSEHNKLRQIIFRSENRLEKTTKEVEEMRKLYVQAKRETDCEMEKSKKIKSDYDLRMRDVEQKLKEMTEEKNNLEEQITRCKQVIQKLQENGTKLEKQLQKRIEQLNSANLHIDNLNLQKQDLQTVLNQKETKLAEVTKQYMASKEVISTITKVASSQLP